jgi:glycosyl transferase family 25
MTEVSINTNCWIISLNPDSERTRTLVASLEAQGIRPRIFRAVDGRHSMPELEAGEYISKVRSRLRRLCDMTPPEVGCYLSHLRLIKQALAAGEQAVFILEDDVQLEPDFAYIISEIEQLPAHVEMVRLMGLKIRKRKIIQPLGEVGHNLVRPERGWLGTQAYYINRAGMEKVVRYGRIIREPIDKFYDHFWEHGLRVFGVEPHLVFEKNVTGSTIQKSDVKRASPPLLYRLLHPLAKGLFSLRRHLHLIINRDEHYPARFPKQRMGRSERIRY